MTFESYYSHFGLVLHGGLAAVLACKRQRDNLLNFGAARLRFLVGLSTAPEGSVGACGWPLSDFWFRKTRHLKSKPLVAVDFVAARTGTNRSLSALPFLQSRDAVHS